MISSEQFQWQKKRIHFICRAEPADRKTDPRSQRNRKPPSFCVNKNLVCADSCVCLFFCCSSFFSWVRSHSPSTMTGAPCHRLGRLPPWLIPVWFSQKNKSNCFLFLKHSIKNGVIPGNFHLLPDDRFKVNVFYRNPVFGLCNASQTPVFSHSAEDTTPRFRKTQSSNALGIFGGQCREPLVRSALPAAVNRRGELQQPRAFLLLYYRLWATTASSASRER